jgi:hypothetical protein
MSFNLKIEIEIDDPTGAWSAGPVAAVMETRCTGYQDAHQMLDRVLTAFGIESERLNIEINVPESVAKKMSPSADVDPDGTVWPAQEERHGKWYPEDDIDKGIATEAQRRMEP